MRRHIFQVVLSGAILLFFAGFPIVGKSQGPPDSNTEIFTDPDLPIDGGVGLLIAAGVGYGIKKYRDERNRSRQARH